MKQRLGRKSVSRLLNQSLQIPPIFRKILIGNGRYAAPPLLTGHIDRIAPTVRRLRLNSPIRNLQNIGFIRSQFHDAVSKYSPPLFVRLLVVPLHACLCC